MENNNQPPAHLVADTPELLRGMMVALNQRNRKRFHFFDIQFADGKWYCWYEISVTEKEMPNANKLK